MSAPDPADGRESGSFGARLLSRLRRASSTSETPKGDDDMTTTLHAPGWVEPEEIDAATIEVLGSVGRRQFAKTADGRELEVGSPIEAFELGNPPTRDEVRVVTTTRKVDPRLRTQGVGITERVIRRAWVREPGTYAGLLRRAEAAAAKRSRSAVRRLVDVADILPALARQDRGAVVLGSTEHTIGGPAPAPGGGVVNVATDTVAGRRTKMIGPVERGPVRGVESIRAWLVSRGIGLDVTPDGRLLVSATRIGPPEVEVVERFEPLLVGMLSGSPVPCALDHGKAKTPAAWTIALPSLPVCRDHLAEDRR